MSYTICLDIDTGGSEPATLDVDWDFTSNCAPMWRHAGADLAKFDGELAGSCVPLLESAIAHMKANPSEYKAMDPLNGWGSYDLLVPALEELVAGFRRHPKATVRVHR